MLLGYQTGGETSTGALPADPRQRWRCFFVDEVENVGGSRQSGPMGTAANYNASRPFNASTTSRRCPRRAAGASLGTTRRVPKNYALPGHMEPSPALARKLPLGPGPKRSPAEGPSTKKGGPV